MSNLINLSKENVRALSTLLNGTYRARIPAQRGGAFIVDMSKAGNSYRLGTSEEIIGVVEMWFALDAISKGILEH